MVTFHKKITDQAKVMLKNQPQVSTLVKQAQQKANQAQSQFKTIKSDWNLLLRLLKAWRAGKYRKIPMTSLLSALATLIYFLNPFDLIPDFIPVTGLVDDLAMIGLLLRSIHGDLTQFAAWEKKTVQSS